MIEEIETEIEKVLQAYYEGWRKAFLTEDAEEIKYFIDADCYQGYWTGPGMDEPFIYDSSLDLKPNIENAKGGAKRIEDYSILVRGGEEEAIVAGVEVFEFEGEAKRAGVMLTWRKIDGNWKLIREYIEIQGKRAAND